MARRNAGSPVILAKMAEGRRSSARSMRRAAEARARKDGEGMSLPALKKLLRRTKKGGGR